MDIILAFRKKPSGIVPSLIKWRTKSEYYHVEVIIPDIDNDFDNGFWISANPEKGVRMKRLVYPLNFEQWDYFKVSVRKAHYKKVMELINNITKYDYATFDLFLRYCLGIKNINTEGKMFCSEVVIEILKVFNEKFVLHDNKFAVDYSPGDIYRLYKRATLVPWFGI